MIVGSAQIYAIYGFVIRKSIVIVLLAELG
jgi:hypothetical protein